MKKLFLLASCLCLFGGGVIGCQNTAEGAKEDAARNGQAVQNATDKAAEDTKNAADTAAEKTKEGAKQTGDALTLTPKVKLAITSDAKLNDSRNLINVDTKDGVVYLKGHVISTDEKKLAGQVAEKAVKDAGSPNTVKNQLTVESH